MRLWLMLKGDCHFLKKASSCHHTVHNWTSLVTKLVGFPNLTFRLQNLWTEQAGLCTSPAARCFAVTSEHALGHAAAGSLEPIKRASFTASREHFEYPCLGTVSVPLQTELLSVSTIYLFERTLLRVLMKAKQCLFWLVSDELWKTC